jgi:hypothetical protein
MVLPELQADEMTRSVGQVIQQLTRANHGNLIPVEAKEGKAQSIKISKQLSNFLFIDE